MNIKSLKLKGLTIFKDETEIDFDAIGDGLIAFVGAKGAGKTTAMEAIFAGLYRHMPSRPGSLYEHSIGKDAFIDLELDNGQPYQALININNASKTMEAHLLKNGNPLCSGKTKEFDELITKEFGPAEMVLSSAFSAQTKTGSFLSLSKADRKDLFAELLGLGKLQELHEKAKEMATTYETELSKKQEYLKLKEEELADKEAVTEKIKEIESEIGMLQRLIENYQTGCEAIQKVISEAEKVQAEATVLEKQKADLIHDQIVRKKRLQVTEVSLVDAEKKNKAKLTEMSFRISDASRILKRRDEVERVEDDLQSIKANVEQKEKEAEFFQGYMTGLRQDVEKLKDDYAKCTSEIKEIEYLIAIAEKGKKTLEGVNCDGKGWINKDCKFIKDAIKKSSELDEYKQRRRETCKEQDQLADKAEELQKKLEDKEEALRVINATLKSFHESEIEANKKIELKSRIEDAEKNIEQLKADLEAEKKEGEQKLQNIRENLEELIEEINTCEAKVRVINEKLSEIKTEDVGQFKLDLSNKNQCIKERSDHLQKVNIEKGQLQNRSKTIREAEEQAIQLRESICRLQEVISDWNILAKAFGKDGIQALEIDSAAPDISATINEILYSCYGSQFSVKFETTKLKADGKAYKEVFDLIVFDNGVERKIENLSGGEKVIISEALSLAISIFNARRSDIRWENLFRDETAGALDPKSAIQYVAMLRKAMEVGKFKKIIFIAHQPEVWQLADAQVHFENGKILL